MVAILDLGWQRSEGSENSAAVLSLVLAAKTITSNVRSSEAITENPSIYQAV
jgi:hypothetical protein